MTTTPLTALACTVVVLAALPFTPAHAQTGVSSADARAIAKEAYIYGYPKPEALNGRWIPPKAQPAQTDSASPTKP